MACQQLRIVNLEMQKKIEVYQDGFIKYTLVLIIAFLWFTKKIYIYISLEANVKIQQLHIYEKNILLQITFKFKNYLLVNKQNG